MCGSLQGCAFAWDGPKTAKDLKRTAAALRHFRKLRLLAGNKVATLPNCGESGTHFLTVQRSCCNG